MMKNEELKKSVSPCNEMIKSKATLSEVCEFIVDCPHSTAIDEGVGYPLIRTPNVGKGRLILTDVHRVSEDVYNLRNARAIPQEDDLIFAREAPAGNVAQIRKGEKVCLGQRTVLLRPNKQFVDSSFLTYYLLAPKQQYRLTGSANGATVAHINLPAIRNFVIEIPDIITQKILGEILSAYDNLIENNNKRIKILEQMAENLYKEWFVRFRFPGHETTPIENGIPQGWEIKKVGKLCEIITGKKDANEATGDGQYPFFTCARETTLSTNEFILDTNAILISGNGSYTGFVKKFSGKFDLYQRTYALFDFKNIEWLFLYWTLKIEFEREYMGGSHGSAIPYITKPNIEKFKIIVPPPKLQKKSQEMFENFYLERCRLESQNQNLIKQRDLLLPRLMSGKLAV